MTIITVFLVPAIHYISHHGGSSAYFIINFDILITKISFSMILYYYYKIIGENIVFKFSQKCNGLTYLKENVINIRIDYYILQKM